ncbi:hypothetical protein EVAR_79980_1 [Eumeta japonica]|uniref:Uncharacterized protein n=1 Tax=Eumeta variegata TaxID=151549 RepID=A0A4C2A777_EUMVA|nr:hypothetical protein EVAR_79980_1 [Eumeta japonica]
MYFTISDFQGLMVEPEEYRLMIGFQGLVTELEVCKLHHQTLKGIVVKNTFPGNSNKPNRVTLFYYGVRLTSAPSSNPENRSKAGAPQL